MEDPAPDLEIEAQDLRQRAWVAAEFYKASRVNDLPEHVCSALVVAWWHDQLDGVVWEGSSDGRDNE